MPNRLRPNLTTRLAWHDLPVTSVLSLPSPLDRGKVSVLAARIYYPSSHPQNADTFSELLRQLKRGDAKLLGPFARFMVKWFVSLHGAIREFDVIVPIPTNPSRLVDRGFAIPETLAVAVSSALGRPTAQALSLTKPTNDLRQISPHQRRREIRDAFAVERPQLVEGKRVLLVDDILTTGATIQEAAKVVLEAEAQQVRAIVLARTWLDAGYPFTCISKRAGLSWRTS